MPVHAIAQTNYRKSRMTGRKRQFRRGKRNRAIRRSGAQLSFTTNRWVNAASAFQDAPASLLITPGASTGVATASLDDYLVIDAPATSNVYCAFTYRPHFKDIVEHEEFAALFDRYKIMGCTFKIMPVVNTYLAAPAGSGGVGAATNSGTCMPIVHWVVDYDSVEMPAGSQAGIDDLRQYSNYKVVRFDGNNKWAKRYWRPKVRGLVASDAVTVQTAAIVQKAPWLDLAAVSVDHFGLRGIIEILNPTEGRTFTNLKVEIKMYFKVANQR